MVVPMRILALDPWLGGSHARLLSAWKTHSRHQIQVEGLPDRHWKWRQAAGALTLAQRINEAKLEPPDALWVSDFVDLPQLRAFLPHAFDRVPAFLYLHENQLTYPRSPEEAFAPDLGPAWSNLVSALAADHVAFNSAYHRQTLRSAAESLLERLPKPKPSAAILDALDRASVVYPGIDWHAIPLGPGSPSKGPLRVLFPHRWEHDKNPAEFLRWMIDAQRLGAEFELYLLGEFSSAPPPDCAEPLRLLAPRIRRQGPLEDRAAYFAAIGSCDVVVSTALHETYGMALLEACAAGCTPLVPNRLAYPEVLGPACQPWAPYETQSEAVRALVDAASDPGELRRAAQRAGVRQAVASQNHGPTLQTMDALMERL